MKVPIQEQLRLVDHNIRNQHRGVLVGWWCERCKRKLYYPANAPKPQCPNCYNSQGLVVRMKRYF